MSLFGERGQLLMEAPQSFAGMERRFPFPAPSHVNLFSPMADQFLMSQATDLSTAAKAEARRSNKPVMEKRRRARINRCLMELKGLIIRATKKDLSRQSKLEKADILEMTVKHLQTVQRQQLAMAVAKDPTVFNEFRGGFSDCADEVKRYISRLEGINPGLRDRLLTHLSGCVSAFQTMTPLTFTAMAAPNFPALLLGSSQSNSGPLGIPQATLMSSEDLNNNQARLLQMLTSHLSHAPHSSPAPSAFAPVGHRTPLGSSSGGWVGPSPCSPEGPDDSDDDVGVFSCSDTPATSPPCRTGLRRRLEGAEAEPPAKGAKLSVTVSQVPVSTAPKGPPAPPSGTAPTSRTEEGMWRPW